MKILGTRIDNLSKQQIIDKIIFFLSKKKFHQIATINPEFILETLQNNEFKNILNNCDLNVADGYGLNFAFWRFGERLGARVAGADLMNEILKIAEINNLKLFLVANSRGLSTWEETRDAILKKYSKLDINGANLDNNVMNYNLLINNYDIIFCNFGAPKQEKFLYSLKTIENSKIKIAMGVGGSFDYLTGKVKRAPVFMRNLGLEWLWRLIQQPRRIRRIINAVIIFPLRIFLAR